MVHKKSGIRDFHDLQDITLAMNASSTFSVFLQKKVPLTGVRIVPYAGNVAQFLLNDDFAQQAYVFSEPYVARSQGGDPHVLMVSDLGFDPYTSVLIAHADLIRRDPRVVRRMVTAAVRGWQAYLEDPGPANEHISRLNEDMDPTVLAYGTEQLRLLCLDRQTGPDRIGRMTAARWQTLADQLVETDALPPGRVDPAKAFTTQFLDAR
jgi:NitT/TauT family transport system substrate-binding protein